MSTEKDRIVERIAETLERTAGVRAVFGEPVKLDDRTVMPVAKVILAGGGGAGLDRGGKDHPDKPAPDLGLGGGGTFQVLPVGFICEVNGEPVFRPIDTPGLVGTLFGGLLPRPIADLVARLLGPVAGRQSRPGSPGQ